MSWIHCYFVVLRQQPVDRGYADAYIDGYECDVGRGLWLCRRIMRINWASKRELLRGSLLIINNFVEKHEHKFNRSNGFNENKCT